MKLFRELNEEIQFIAEEKGSRKLYFIEGIFLQGDLKNRNGRIYPMDVLEPEVIRYIRQMIEPNRAYGELGHPDGPTINLERASHLIKSLKRQGSNFYGRAEIIDENPYGKMVVGFLNHGARLAVSSRGLGSLQEYDNAKIVQKDFMLATAADIVADPSAPDAYVDGVMEGKEWVWDNGILREEVIAGHKQTLVKAGKRNLEKTKIRVFSEFLDRLSKSR